jgi:ABC-type nitrate/sulfonate/bicarbonate transport system substrate-binding protein
MPRNNRPALKLLKKSRPLVVGFLPENDCAPVIVAHEMGLFAKYGLAVELHCQASWKHIHDNLVHRHLDAAHAPGMLPFLINLGLTPEKCGCVTALILSLQGNSIILSRELAGEAAPFGEHTGSKSKMRIYTFGVPCPLASQYSLLCQWLKGKEQPDPRHVRIVTAPSWQMFPMLKLGYLDGYCAGEPWGSVAVQAGAGVCVATSSLLAPLHPEKVLLVRKDFAEHRGEEHERLIAALLEAALLCHQPDIRKQLGSLLSRSKYVNAPADCIEAGLLGPAGPTDAPVQPLHALNIFHRHRANDPTTARAAWITGRLYEFLRWQKRPACLDDVFRRDIFLRAQARVKSEVEQASEDKTPSQEPHSNGG